MINNNSLLKVLLVSTSFPIASGSQSGIFVEHLAHYLSKQHSLMVLTPDDNHNNQSRQTKKTQTYALKLFRYAPKKWQILAHQPGGIPVALKMKPWLSFLIPLFIWALFFSLLKQARHVQIIHANWSVIGMLAGIAGFIMRKPVITTARGSDITRIRQSRIDRLITMLCLVSNRYVICVSESIHNELCLHYPFARDKLKIIHNGVDQALLDIHRHAKSTSHPLKLITVGNLIQSKSINTIISAMAECDNCILTIVGDGSELQQLKAQTRHAGIEERVIFKGALAQQIVFTELAKADVFILASKSEGRPNVVIEAMAAGLPVIVSKIDAVTSFIKADKTGLLFDVGDPHQLAQGIQQLMNNPELRLTLGEAGRQYIVNQKLTWENCAGHYSELYFNAVDSDKQMP